MRKCIIWDIGLKTRLDRFKNGELKDDIMANFTNIKQPIAKFQGICVAHDLHPKEKQKIKQLVKQAKHEHINSASDDVEN